MNRYECLRNKIIIICILLLSIFTIIWCFINNDPWYTFILPVIGFVLCVAIIVGSIIIHRIITKKEKNNEDA